MRFNYHSLEPSLASQAPSVEAQLPRSAVEHKGREDVNCEFIAAHGRHRPALMAIVIATGFARLFGGRHAQ